MLVCGPSYLPVVFQLQQRMEIRLLPAGWCGVSALLVVAAGSSRRRIHSTGMGIRESSHAQLHHCLPGCRLRTVHVRIFDRQHAVLHVSPSPPPAGIVGPSFHVKPDRWLLPRALGLHPPVSNGYLLDGDHECNGFGCAGFDDGFGDANWRISCWISTQCRTGVERRCTVHSSSSESIDADPCAASASRRGRSSATYARCFDEGIYVVRVARCSTTVSRARPSLRVLSLSPQRQG